MTRRPSTVLATAAAVLLAGLAGCSVSQQQEVQLGAQEAQQVQSQMPMLDDPVVAGYVNQLGQRIASRTPRADLSWQFGVVNTDVVNAFALPGGFVYVNRGVLERTTQMDELAGVLGHEIEHVVLRHSVKQMEAMQGANVGVALACTLTQVCQSQAAAAAVNVGGTLAFDKFSRTDEKQADDGGFQNVINAGINPTGMLTFFEKLLQEEQQAGGGGSGVSAWFSDHPGTQDRIADIRARLEKVPQSELAQLQTNDAGFQQMKARLAQLPPAPPPQRQGQ